MDELKTKPQIFTLGQSSLGLTGAFFIPRNTIVAEPQDKELSLSYLGTPIYSSLEFKAVTASDDNNLPSDVQDITKDGLELTEVMLTVQQTRNIVRTPLNGRDGTVKEYISDGDFSVTVEGLIVGEYPNVFPTEQVKTITTYVELKQSLEIGSVFLNFFGITKVVVQEYSFYEVEGMRNQVAFRLLMWSDSDFKIEPTQNAVT